MKTAFLLLAGLLMRGLQTATAQIDTTNARYCRPVFPTMTVTPNVPYTPGTWPKRVAGW